MVQHGNTDLGLCGDVLKCFALFFNENNENLDLNPFPKWLRSVLPCWTLIP